MDDEKNKHFEDFPQNSTSETSDTKDSSDKQVSEEKPSETEEFAQDESEEDNGLDSSHPKEKSFLFNIPSFYWKILATTVLILAAIIGLFSTCSSPEPPKKIYSIAIDKSWYPLQLGIKDRNMTAFVETVLQTIARNEKLQFRIMASTPRNLFPGLESGRYEGILSLLTPEQSYAFNFLFSQPLYYLGPVIIVNPESSYTSLESLKGRNVGYMSNIKYHIDFEANPATRFIPYNNIPQAFAHLESRRVDAVIMNSLPAHTYLQSLYADKFKIATAPLTDEGIRLVLQHDGSQAEQFMKLFNEGLDNLRKNGTYDELLEKWDLVNTEWKNER